MNIFASRLAALYIAWSSLTLCVLGILIALDVQNAHHRLDAHTSAVTDHIYNQSRLDKVLLKNFAALISASPTQHNILKTFANEARQQFPHISQFRLYQVVDVNSVDALASAQQTRGYEYYAPTARSVDNPNELLIPIVFTNPYSAETKHLIGTDLRQVSADIAQLVLDDNWRVSPIASLPFTINSDQLAYALYYRVQTSEINSNRYIASLVVSFENVFGSLPATNEAFFIDVVNGHGQPLYHSPSTNSKPESRWFDLEAHITLERFGQQWRIQVTHPLNWRDFQWIPLFLVLLASVMLLYLTRAYLFQLKEAENARQRSFDALEAERSRLEESVRERTQALSEQMNENRELVHRVIHVQEQERRYLARELHDELSQSLTAIRTDASILKTLHPQTSSVIYQSADSINTIAEHIYGVTYDMMRALRPTSLDDLGLVDAIRECISNMRLRNKGIEIQTEFSGALNDMDEQANITLYRLVQEALTNIVKHADADEIHLTLSRSGYSEDEDTVELTITDNGHGFDRTTRHSSKTSGGFGLISMRERALALGGTLTVESNTDQVHGTMIKACFPVPESETEKAEDDATPDLIETVAPAP
ncbi:MAG: ATP-binding protein [Pontibacterium sp.]